MKPLNEPEKELNQAEKVLKQNYQSKLAERLMQAGAMAKDRQLLRRGATKQQDGTLGKETKETEGDPTVEDDMIIRVGDETHYHINQSPVIEPNVTETVKPTPPNPAVPDTAEITKPPKPEPPPMEVIRNDQTKVPTNPVVARLVPETKTPSLITKLLPLALTGVTTLALGWAIGNYLNQSLVDTDTDTQYFLELVSDDT